MASTEGSDQAGIPPGSGSNTLDTQPQRDDSLAHDGPSSDPAGQRESYHSNVVPGGDSAGAVPAARAETGQIASNLSAAATPVPDDAELMAEDTFDDAMLKFAESQAEPSKYAPFYKVAMRIAEGGFPHVMALKSMSGGQLQSYMKRVRDSVYEKRFGIDWKKLVPGEVPLISPDGAGAVPAASAEGRDSGPSRPVSVSPSPQSPSQEIVSLGLRHCSGSIKVLRDEYDHHGAETETSSAYGDRMDHYGSAMAEAGETPESVEFAQAVGKQVRALSKEFIRRVEKGEVDPQVRIQAWSVANIDTEAYMERGPIMECMVALHGYAYHAKMDPELLRQATSSLRDKFYQRAEREREQDDPRTSDFESPASGLTGGLEDPYGNGPHPMAYVQIAPRVGGAGEAPSTPERRHRSAVTPEQSPTQSQNDRVSLAIVETLQNMNKELKKNRGGGAEDDEEEGVGDEKVRTMVALKLSQELPQIPDHEADFDTF